ncbi:hypothetical protein B0T25DRAFT_517330 [Lasiosphaeria hispida]|uniref:Cyanovirin-N domain-containing protein n=1 Tax=Lasiosphaeria hispida TaxID=260671 RepID=A0AAJ0HN74_9PEZI|nr:hypothetical protein B0T25DRAFT_517330 [Lasiosphaeria hispida]
MTWYLANLILSFLGVGSFAVQHLGHKDSLFACGEDADVRAFGVEYFKKVHVRSIGWVPWVAQNPHGAVITAKKNRGGFCVLKGHTGIIEKCYRLQPYKLHLEKRCPCFIKDYGGGLHCWCTWKYHFEGVCVWRGVKGEIDRVDDDGLAVWAAGIKQTGITDFFQPTGWKSGDGHYAMICERAGPLRWWDLHHLSGSAENAFPLA